MNEPINNRMYDDAMDRTNTHQLQQEAMNVKYFMYIGAHVIPMNRVDKDEVEYTLGENKLHVTLAYDEVGATSMFDINQLGILKNAALRIKDVTYWDKADVTVAELDCERLHVAQQTLDAAGFGYNYEFRPHVTLGKGDLTKTVGILITAIDHLLVTDVYMQIIKREVEA